jgi:hypothetical protein
MSEGTPMSVRSAAAAADQSVARCLGVAAPTVDAFNVLAFLTFGVFLYYLYRSRVGVNVSLTDVINRRRTPDLDAAVLYQRVHSVDIQKFI